jgi:hypothetical protein
MATAKPLPRKTRRRWGRRAFIAAAVLAAALLALFWSTMRSEAIAGASVGARVACSCRYLGGRELSDCRKDFEPGMGLVMLSEDDAAKAVTARVPLLASETATFRAGEGCTLEKWSH